MAALSKTQIDRLGDCLKRGPSSQDDLRLLDQYRRSFGTAYETVITTVRDRLQLEPTGRLAKSTGSIIEKLRRESIRLSQVQDIAGCRVVVEHVAEQERVVASLRSVFRGCSVIDRRENPSYGYRAVHIIARTSAKLIEVQVRTYLQHLWAEVSERISDISDPAIKYGGGEAKLQEALMFASKKVVEFEELELDMSRLKVKPGYNEQLQVLRDQMSQKKKQFVESYVTVISILEIASKQKNDFLN